MTSPPPRHPHAPRPGAAPGCGAPASSRCCGSSEIIDTAAGQPARRGGDPAGRPRRAERHPVRATAPRRLRSPDRQHRAAAGPRLPDPAVRRGPVGRASPPGVGRRRRRARGSSAALGTVHIGASGLVFGWLTYLIVRGLVTRRPGRSWSGWRCCCCTAARCGACSPASRGSRGRATCSARSAGCGGLVAVRATGAGGVPPRSLRSPARRTPQRMVPALSLASEREMTIRWIWLVPSKICMTLASRM